MQKVKVLIIEDEQSVADALKLVIEDQGYEVTLALSARDGFEQYDRRKFDLTITDVNLPDISGLDVLLRLRASTPLHPIIVITAHYTPEIVTTAKERGALEVLSKPFLPSEIINLVRRASCGINGVRCV
jgi:DNA-binding NtrC family response regulator